MDILVKNDQNAPPPSTGMRGDPNRVYEIGRAVSVGAISAVHRTGQHDWNCPAKHQLEREGCFLQRIRAVGDDHPAGSSIRKLLNETRQLRHVVQVDAGTGLEAYVTIFNSNVSSEIEMREQSLRIVGWRHPSLGLTAHRYRAAHRKHANFRARINCPLHPASHVCF